MKESTAKKPVATTGPAKKPTIPSKRKFSESSGSSYKRVGKSRMKHTEESSAEPIDEDDEERKSEVSGKKRNQKVAVKKHI